MYWGEILKLPVSPEDPIIKEIDRKVEYVDK